MVDKLVHVLLGGNSGNKHSYYCMLSHRVSNFQFPFRYLQVILSTSNEVSCEYINYEAKRYI